MATENVIVCHDCGSEVFAKPAYLLCGCRVGFVAQWDVCLGHGRFLGRIVDPLPVQPDTSEVMK